MYMPFIITGTCPCAKHFYLVPNVEFYPEAMSQVKN